MFLYNVDQFLLNYKFTFYKNIVFVPTLDIKYRSTPLFTTKSDTQTLLRYTYYIPIIVGDRGGTVVKVLRYKSEGRWFDSRWCHWNFSLA